jgi:hypothetical protein
MSSSFDDTIDRLNAQLRVLDRQNAWLESMIENWDAINTPPTRVRRHRSLPPSPPRDRLGEMLDMIEVSEDFIPTDDEDDEEEDPFDLGEYAVPPSEYPITDDESVATVVYTVVARSNQRAYDEDSDSDDDDETVVEEWENPNLTPYKSVYPDYFLESPGW